MIQEVDLERKTITYMDLDRIFWLLDSLPPCLSALSFTLPHDCCVFFPSPQKENTRDMPYWICPCPEDCAANTQSTKVFIAMSVSSRQALDHRTQPHLIRTRLFDLLHYPVITQTGNWRTRGFALTTLNWGKISPNQSQTSIHSHGCCVLPFPMLSLLLLSNWRSEMMDLWMHGWMMDKLKRTHFNPDGVYQLLITFQRFHWLINNSLIWSRTDSLLADLIIWQVEAFKMHCSFY